MRKLLPILFAGAAVLLVTPLAALAQDGAESVPVFHYLTVSTFDSPGGEAGGLVNRYIRTVLAPVAKIDPNVVSFKVARHNWGSNSAQIVLVYEYADWASLEGDCEECAEWFQATRPEDGTPERDEWRAMTQAYFAAYLGHSDEIYSVNMSLAK